MTSWVLGAIATMKPWPWSFAQSQPRAQKWPCSVRIGTSEIWFHKPLDSLGFLQLYSRIHIQCSEYITHALYHSLPKMGWVKRHGRSGGAPAGCCRGSLLVAYSVKQNSRAKGNFWLWSAHSLVCWRVVVTLLILEVQGLILTMDMMWSFEGHLHCSGGATCLASDQWRPAAGGNLKRKGEQKALYPFVVIPLKADP